MGTLAVVFALVMLFMLLVLVMFAHTHADVNRL